MLVAPALELQPLPLDAAALPLPNDFDLVMFVSGYAVSCYLHACKARVADFSWPATTWAACVGAATASALLDSGLIPPGCVVCPEPLHDTLTSAAVSVARCSADEKSASFGNDSEALWQTLQPLLPRLKRVLIVRGETGRDWLARQLNASGIQVRVLKMYRRLPALWTPDVRQAVVLAFNDPAGPVTVLTSRESVDAFLDNLVRAISAPFLERACFVVIHPRVADHLQSALQRSGMVLNPVVKLSSPGDDALFQVISELSSPALHS